MPNTLDQALIQRAVMDGLIPGASSLMGLFGSGRASSMPSIGAAQPGTALPPKPTPSIGASMPGNGLPFKQPSISAAAPGTALPSSQPSTHPSYFSGQNMAPSLGPINMNGGGVNVPSVTQSPISLTKPPQAGPSSPSPFALEDTMGGAPGTLGSIGGNNMGIESAPPLASSPISALLSAPQGGAGQALSPQGGAGGGDVVSFFKHLFGR